MSHWIDAVATFVCALLAAGATIFLLNTGASPAMAGVAGIAVFGVGSQLQNVGMRRRDRFAQARELNALKRADLIMSDQLSAFLSAAEARTAKAEAAHLERETQLRSEMKLVEQLMRQFAESMVKRVQTLERGIAEAARAPRPAPRAEPIARAAAAPFTPQAFALAPQPALPTVSLEQVQEALMDNRVDLHLQPIVSLPQRKLRFYEAFTRLRDETGAILRPDQYLPVAEEAGIVSTLDNLLLFRSVQFVRRLHPKQREIAVFCNISVASVNDSAFFQQFVDFMRAHRDLKDQIVFEFAQEAFAAMGPGEDTALKALADLGFVFSMDRVTDLALDLAAMRRRGVRFIKIAANVLLDPQAETNLGIRLEDLRDRLAREGIALIGDRIETERQVIDLLDFQIDYGQGFLFGEPRPPREEPQEAPRAEETPPPAKPAAGGMTALFEARSRKRA